MTVASVAYGPFLDERDEISNFRIPMNLIRNRKSAYLGELAQVDELRLREEKIDEFSSFSLISSTLQFSNEEVEMAWNLTPLLLKNERFLNAFRFLKTSQENFYVWPGEIDDVVENADTTARNVFHQSRLENALQDSFKAIEAVLGDPPKNDERFFQKILSIGLDPCMKFGMEDKPVYQVIRDMNKARDKKAAHGSTTNRIIPIGELLEYQYCARLIVLQASKFEIGDRGEFAT